MTSPHEPNSGWTDWVPFGLGGILIVLGAVGAVAGQFAWDGPWVSAVGVALIILGALVAFWDKVVTPLRTSRETRRKWAQEQQDNLRSIVEVAPASVSEIDPYEIGVFESDLANRAAEEAGSAEPPYVERDIDSNLNVALSEEALADNRRLVVVRGDPKSGKSRTLWEGLLRNVPNRMLIALRPPLTTDDEAPESQPLLTLLHVGMQAPEEGLVVWLDDAHQHVEHGLTVRNLERLIEKYPGVIVAMTFHISELERLTKIDKPLLRLLEPASESHRLDLNLKLSNSELASARAEYPTLADNEELAWLPEWFAAVNLLRKRYGNNRVNQPVGVAVVKAAIDWRRCGMPRAIPENTLRELAKIALWEAMPNRTLDDEAFNVGLMWAKEEVASHSALLLKSTNADDPDHAR